MVSSLYRLNLCKTLLDACVGAESSARQTLQGPDPPDQIKKRCDVVNMKTIMKRISLASAIVEMVGALFATGVEAQPANFPGFTVTTYNSNAVAPGSIFLSVTDAGTNGAYYMMILTNNGAALWCQAATNDGHGQCGDQYSRPLLPPECALKRHDAYTHFN